MSAPPYMKLYVGDYLGDTHHLGALEHGAYMLLLMAMWRAGGSLPAADANLTKLARCTPDQWAEIRDTVLAFFRRSRGRLTHKRVGEEMAKYETISRKRSEAVQAREQKKSNKDKAPAASSDGSCDARLTTKPEPEPESKKEERSNDLFVAGAATSDPPAKYPDLFEAAWQAYRHVKGRSSKKLSLGQWKRLRPEIREALPAACGRYSQHGREPNDACGAQAMERWLRDEKFADWLADTPCPPDPKGPHDPASHRHPTDKRARREANLERALAGFDRVAGSRDGPG